MNIDTSRIEKLLRKLKQKDPALFRAVQRKINQIAQLDRETINHFKNLRGNMSNYKRVHIGSFVLMFKVENDTIIFDKLRHHDEAY
ncbi:addiction module toxin RelE [Candidatus Woesearchaeota archaeon]|nr:addiction module toxin RelE [Candidatus Woesearchaeota archaeon]MBU3941770.1 type II toxin-antitoxin system RelE/ParE family toxin [Nanoarchaeota archaeon]